MSSSLNKLQKQVVQSMDCPCSSLAINCCQLGCFIANAPRVEYAHSHSDWMTQLASDSPSLKLRDLVIPGSHDSGSYSIGKTKMFSAAGRTQNSTVLEQLHRGIRYLDLRVAGSGMDEESVYIYHGFLSGAKFESVLQQIVQFLEEYPGEFVFIEVVQEFGRQFSPAQRKYTLDLLQSKLGGKVFTDNDRTKLLDRWTLKDLAVQKKQVCVLLHSRIYNFEHDNIQYSDSHVVEIYGFFNSQKWMRSHWHNTRDMSTLLDWNLEEVRKHGPDRKIILNNQFVLTPGVGGLPDVFKLLFGQASLRPVSLATKLYGNDVLDDYLRTNASEPWNLVMLDFVDLAPALVSFLISLNFSSKLTVLSAATHSGLPGTSSIDVTDKMLQYIKRGKVLYLTNVSRDLGLDYTEGKLTMAYKFKSGVHHILDVDFDENTQVLVSQYSQNEGVLVHIDTTNELPSHGICYRGRIISKETLGSSDHKDGTVLEYATKSSGVKFSIVN